VTKTWTKIEDWIADPFVGYPIKAHDCVYPDCLIEVDGCRACEHACPFERVKAAGESSPPK
jgi:hypothetical protein